MNRFISRQSLIIVAMLMLALPASAVEITTGAYTKGAVQYHDPERNHLMAGGIGASGVAFQTSAYRNPYGSRPLFYSNGIALFDLGALDRRVSSGNLRLNVGSNPSWGSYNLTTETVAVYDVGTDLQNTVSVLSTFPRAFASTPTGSFLRSLFYDLQGGALYGNTQVAATDRNGVVSIPLTAQAVDDINTAAGTVMGMGFTTKSPYTDIGFNGATLALNPFGDPVDGGGGLDFLLDDADVAGTGTVDLTPLGVRHSLDAYAGGAQTTDQTFSEVQRRFYFESDSPDPVSVILSANLSGRFFVDQGSASVNSMVSLYDRAGAMIDTASYFNELSGFGELDINEYFELEVDLFPDEIYEIVSRVDLSASIFSPTGSASALFGDTFEVQLSAAGALPPGPSSTIPEPSTVLLLGSGLLGLGALRKRFRR